MSAAASSGREPQAAGHPHLRTRSRTSTPGCLSASSRPDTETVTYLGHPIVLYDDYLHIYSPDGVSLFAARIELSSARRFIRGYRAEGRKEN